MSDAAEFTLYDYWRSSACYRVRIALNLKGLRYVHKPVHLLRNGGEQHADAHRQLNPQESVPVLVHGDCVVRQSLAIVEYLEEVVPHAPKLLPAEPAARARVRALAQLVACDIHPLNNLRVVQYLEREHALDQSARERWMRHWMTEGFRALDALLVEPETGRYCHGDEPGLADACLVPQVYNADRFKVDMTPFPRVRRIADACLQLPAFAAAVPERQPDAA